MVYGDEDVPSKFTWPTLDVEGGEAVRAHKSSALHVHLATSDELFHNEPSENGSR